VLGVDYFHWTIPEQGDLFLTPFGLPLAGALRPERWYARDWFAHHRERLVGTSSIYRVHTRPWRGLSLDLVV